MERFWKKVNKRSGVFGADGKYPTECWIWMAGKDSWGYGVFSYKSKAVGAHKFIWQMSQEEPIGYTDFVCHYCDMPACVNPKHLYIGNHKKNMLDMISRNRAARPKGESHGGCKLTQKAVDDIREKYATGKHTHETLAVEYGISRVHVGQIIRRDRWSS